VKAEHNRIKEEAEAQTRNFFRAFLAAKQEEEQAQAVDVHTPSTPLSPGSEETIFGPPPLRGNFS
jgi:hypothetical protein